jgi:chemotaxis protein histidine kinase CheA
LELIVLGFTEGEAFAALVNDYQRFLRNELGELVGRIEESGARDTLLRRLHTFKGLLAQFSFPLSPSAIHEVESRFAAHAHVSGQDAFEALGLKALAEAFEQDLASVSDLLGPGFDAAGGRILVSQVQLRAMEQLARTAIASDPAHATSMPLRLLMQTLSALGRFNVKSALGLHSRGAPTLASRLQKELEPVIIEGDDVTLAPERYGEFFRSLVHVFRNAVDHGIEAPEARLRAGKQSAGSIRCVVRDRGRALEILIADDGAGIDRRALERKLIESGEDRACVERMALAELVFREGLSSRVGADQVSGRGVGLAAVKAELDRLGGAIAIETELEVGTAFTFTLPYETENRADGAQMERLAV